MVRQFGNALSMLRCLQVRNELLVYKHREHSDTVFEIRSVFGEPRRDGYNNVNTPLHMRISDFISL